jgi:prevent-host-death family protein
MTRITTSEARRRFAELVTHARHRGARIVLTHYGRPVAALVPVADLNKLTEASPGHEDGENAGNGNGSGNGQSKRPGPGSGNGDVVPVAIRHASDALLAARQVLGPAAVVHEDGKRGEKLVGVRGKAIRIAGRPEGPGPAEIRGRGVNWAAAFAALGLAVVELESLVTHEGDTWRVTAIHEGGHLGLDNGRLQRTAPVAAVRPFQPAR